VIAPAGDGAVEAAGASLVTQSRAIAVWKALEYLGLAVFTVVLPRAMGPALFGRFAVVVSLVGVLSMASALGAQATLGRFVPEYRARGETSRIRALFTQLFALRVVVAAGLATTLLLFHAQLLPDSTLALGATAAGAFLCVALAMVTYHLLYGLNQLGRSLVHDSVARLALVGLVFALGGHRDLQRAAAALLLAELLLLVLGLVWTRSWFDIGAARRQRTELPHQLKFGLNFFGTNLLLLAVWRGGELAVVYLSGSTTEVAYYSIANAVALTMAMLIGQLMTLLLPQLTGLATSARTDEANRLIGAAVKYLTVLAFAFLLVVGSIGPWIVVGVLGPAYEPVADNLRVLSLAVVPVALLRAAVTVAMVRKAMSDALAMAGAGLLVFAVTAIVAVPGQASFGASLAAVIASAATAAVGAWRFGLLPVLRLARLGRVLLFGFAAALIVTQPYGPAAARLAVAVSLFAALLLWGRVVTPAELRRLATAARPHRQSRS
jgi:O-antigen/teichoic acid export membrane protein